MPYDAELSRLHETYADALETDRSDLQLMASTLAGGPLVAVGSGGSFSAATFLARFHETATGHLGVARTPFSFLTAPPPVGTTVALLSASGENRDIIESFEHARTADAEAVLVVTNDGDSELARRAGDCDSATVLDCDLAVDRDGYLATNTLLGTVVVLARAYRSVIDSDVDWALPPREEAASLFSSVSEQIHEATRPVRDRETLVVVSGGWSSVAAVDAESRLVESGLKTVQLTDPRNFAHGRYQWLVRRPDDTGVLAFSDPQTAPTVSNTLERLPATVPVVDLSTDYRGPAAGIHQLIRSMYLPLAFRSSTAFDPAAPSVPSWAESIHLEAPELDRRDR